MWKIDTFNTCTVKNLKRILLNEIRRESIDCNSCDKLLNSSFALDNSYEEVKLEELHLHFQNKNMKDSLTLADYGMIGGICSAMSTQIIMNDNKSLRLAMSNRRANPELTGGDTDRAATYELTLVIVKRKQGKFSIDVDMKFNSYKDVTAVEWSEIAPDFREVTDGMCWLGY